MSQPFFSQSINTSAFQFESKGRSYPAEMLDQTLDTPIMRTFETGATRNSDVDKLDYEGFLSPKVLTEYAKYLHQHRLQADGKLRASDNWQQGIPKDVYFKSFLRHTFEAWTQHRTPNNGLVGYSVEDRIAALMAVAFNVFGYTFELIRERDANNV